MSMLCLTYSVCSNLDPSAVVTTAVVIARSALETAANTTSTKCFVQKSLSGSTARPQLNAECNLTDKCWKPSPHGPDRAL